MKIQNKSARLWIGLGLLGLIMFGIRSFVGPFGGIIVEMLSDAGIIFLLVGIYLESKGKKKSESQGFIPLIMAIVIGLVVVGGTVATIAIKAKNPELAAPKAPVTEMVRDQNEPGELINNLQGITPTKTETGAVAQKTEVVLTAEINIICQNQIIKTASKGSLRGDIKALCEKIISDKYSQEEINNLEESIQERWKLWQIAQKGEESAVRRAEDIETMYGGVQD